MDGAVEEVNPILQEVEKIFEPKPEDGSDAQEIQSMVAKFRKDFSSPAVVLELIKNWAEEKASVGDVKSTRIILGLTDGITPETKVRMLGGAYQRQAKLSHEYALSGAKFSDDLKARTDQANLYAQESKRLFGLADQISTRVVDNTVFPK